MGRKILAATDMKAHDDHRRRRLADSDCGRHIVDILILVADRYRECFPSTDFKDFMTMFLREFSALDDNQLASLPREVWKVPAEDNRLRNMIVSEWDGHSGGSDVTFILESILVMCSLGTRAIRAYEKLDDVQAWKLAGTIQVALALSTVIPNNASSMLALGKSTAMASIQSARHAVNRAKAAKLDEWLHANEGRWDYLGNSWKNKAAEDAARELGMNKKTARNKLINK